MKKNLLCIGLALVAGSSLLAANAGNGPKARIFTEFDANKNGIIDGSEISAVRAAFKAEPKGQFARYDTNHDGALSTEELAEIKPPGARKGGGKSDASKKGRKNNPPATEAKP